MRALSELFDETTLVLPVDGRGPRPGEIPLHGPRLRIAALRPLKSSGLLRRWAFPFWLLSQMPRMLREFFRADAVHAPIPGDVGTIGMLLAFVLRKPLFVRHCGNWFVQKTAPERYAGTIVSLPSDTATKAPFAPPLMTTTAVPSRRRLRAASTPSLQVA